MPASAAIRCIDAPEPSRRTPRSAASRSCVRRSAGAVMLTDVTASNTMVGMADQVFSLELNDDQRELQKWLHEFAADVIRPAAHEWDEREETPWPVIQEAAKVGIYSLDFMAQQWFDDSGLGMVLAQEELFWGDAGIGLAIMGTGLAAA